MATEPEYLDIRDEPEILRLVEEVRKGNRPCVLTRADEQLAVITPLQPTRRRKRRTGIITRDDPLYKMVGTGKSGIPGGISGRKYDHFRRAFGVDNEER
jgi:hypothetical protein